MKLTPLEKLAKICPQCFGPLLNNPCKSEPDYVVCFDGNFQHRRHASSSKEWSESSTTTPSSFLDLNELKAWQARVQQEVPLVSEFMFSTCVESLLIFFYRILAPSNTLQQTINALLQLGEAVMKQDWWWWHVGMTTVWVLSTWWRVGNGEFYNLQMFFYVLISLKHSKKIVLCASAAKFFTQSNQVWRSSASTNWYTLWHWLYNGERYFEG